MIPGAMETNLTPASRYGTTVTASATPNTKGSWTELIASTGADAEGIWVAIEGVAASATATDLLLDIGTGAASSEVVLVPDVSMGWAPSLVASATHAQTRFFPVAIPAGTRISARMQAAVGSETGDVAIWLAQSIQHLEGASAVEAVGEDTTNSRGTSVTSGNDAWGSWTSLGTISADRNCLVPSFDGLGDTTLGSGRITLLQLGYGSSAPGSGGTAIDAVWRFTVDTGEEIGGGDPQTAVYADLASGETIWARLADTGDIFGVMVNAMECPVASGGGSAVIRR